MPADDTNLIIRFNQNAESAFTRVYTALYAGLFLYAQRLMGDEELAKDMVASSFVKLWQMEKRFETLAHISRYLRRLIYNQGMDHFRQIKVAQKWQESLRSDNGFIEEPVYEEQMESALFQRIMAHIDSLPTFTRTIFKLAYLEGKSNSQIAVSLGIEDQTVRNKKSEALKSLKMRFGNTRLLLFIFA